MVLAAGWRIDLGERGIDPAPGDSVGETMAKKIYNNWAGREERRLEWNQRREIRLGCVSGGVLA